MSALYYVAANGLELTNVIEGFALNHHCGEILCHVVRAGHKPGESRLHALLEAQWHLNREIEVERERQQPVE